MMKKSILALFSLPSFLRARKKDDTLSNAITAFKAGDYKTSIRIFQHLAEQGVAGAQLPLGAMYYDGRVVSQDYKQAFMWWTKAAEQNNADAQYNLGVMYYEGKEVPQNLVIGFMWFNLAVSNGYENAITYKDAILKEMMPDQIAQGQQMTADWLAKHSKSN